MILLPTHNLLGFFIFIRYYPKIPCFHSILKLSVISVFSKKINYSLAVGHLVNFDHQNYQVPFMNFNFLVVRQQHFKITDGVIENNAK